MLESEQSCTCPPRVTAEVGTADIALIRTIFVLQEMNNHSVGMRTVSQQIDGVTLPVIQFVRETNSQAPR